jgi:Zn-dependent protease with chaperone function
VDAAQAERIKRIMVPLIQAMNHPRSLDKVKLAVTSDQEINAASAGGGEFYVTAGLLQKANDKQLMAVLAHEVAHDDLGHVAKAQALGAVTGIGAIILIRYFPVPARSRLSRALSSHVATAGRKSTTPTSTAWCCSTGSVSPKKS